jgi:CRP-like cAMP-binding protein
MAGERRHIRKDRTRETHEMCHAIGVVMFNAVEGPHVAAIHSSEGLSLRRSAADALMQNQLLSALTSQERARLLGGMQRVSLTLGQVIYEVGARLEHACLPTSSVISSIYTTHEGATAQTALIGHEGITGIGLFLKHDTAHYRTVVQIPGKAFKASAQLLQAEFARGETFQHTILRYSHAFLTQLSQTAVCNRLHSVEQRLCRWLLECDDRVNGAEIRTTQENIAHMLGVRREGVTLAAGRVKDAGLIRYSRGHIHILDRQRLEMMACECYRVLEQEVNWAANQVKAG